MPSTRTLTTATLSALATLIASPLALAHHGAVTQPSLYLTDNFVELQGEIVEVLWRNPHTRARMRVVVDNGEELLWEIEMAPTPREWEQRGINEENLFGSVRAAGYISRSRPRSGAQATSSARGRGRRDSSAYSPRKCFRCSVRS